MRLFIFFTAITLSLTFWACNGNTETASKAPKAEAETDVYKAPDKKIIKKAPVTIIPSDGRDYPEVVKDLGFPINSKAEVVNVGNAIIEGDGLFMRLNVQDNLENTARYYEKEMKALNWEQAELKIFQGADKALRFTKDDINCRLIMIEEDDYTKLAVQMTKKVNPADYEDR